MDLDALRAELLRWYQPRHHAYAWRRVRRTPYRTLVSEVMLQQTQAARVEPIYARFLDRFPNVATLAAASRADVLRAWRGLGYNRRAIALHEAAREIVRDHGGRVPRDVEALRRLPGIGPYTAGAVAVVGRNEPVVAMDTNVRRVCARAIRGAEPDEVPAVRLADDARSWLDPDAPRTWTEAVMDLGRLVCRPTPRCDACPLSSWCRFRASGRAGRSSGRRQSPFEGSRRQVRGAIVDVLRATRSASPAALAERTGHRPDRIAAAATSLVDDGIVERTRSGLLRLAR